jgi:hypothetical protein
MGFDKHEGATREPGTNAELQSNLLEGTWTRPLTTPTDTNAASAESAPLLSAVTRDFSPGTGTLDLASGLTNFAPGGNDSKSAQGDPALSPGLSSPTFVNSDGTPASLSDLYAASQSLNDLNGQRPIELAAMTLSGLNLGGDMQADVLPVSDRRNSSRSSAAAERLARAAHASVGTSELGNVVPRNAREFPGMRLDINVQCASTSSDLLIQSKLMNSRDYKISVDGLSTWLGQNGFTRVPLRGDFDLSKFPDGPIGFIAGKGNVTDGSNHIGFIEKRNGEVRVIHNNWRTGAVVDQNINEKFYDKNGKPQYNNLALYMFPRS